MKTVRLNTPKKSKKNQNYEKYWKSTMALVKWNGDQFIRTLALIIEHIDKYQLQDKNDDELIANLNSKRKHFNQNVAHSKELENKIMQIFPNDSTDGATTRKQINEYIKLGFIKPYLKGYVKGAKDYIKENIDNEERKRIFSDIVYNYSSFNSSQTNDDSTSNQIKFLVNTLLNKKNKVITFQELIGMMKIDIKNRSYATEKEINSSINWVNHINFQSKKYNQISHLTLILSNMSFLKVSKNQRNSKEFKVCLAKDAKNYLPKVGDTKRDPYRYAVMKRAVHNESIKYYKKEICWLSKRETKGLVVSHIYDSATALRNYDIDAAYDPNNALLLAPGNEDQYFDKKEITINPKNGKLILSNNVSNSFRNESTSNNYHIDKYILNKERQKYLYWHNNEFSKKNDIH